MATSLTAVGQSGRSSDSARQALAGCSLAGAASSGRRRSGSAGSRSSSSKTRAGVLLAGSRRRGRTGVPRVEVSLDDSRRREARRRRAGGENDPRVTRIGRLMRATAMDELPQLWSIFIGDMSFVGPRALRPGEIETDGSGELIHLEDVPGYKERHGVRPGLTGSRKSTRPATSPAGTSSATIASTSPTELLAGCRSSSRSRSGSPSVAAGNRAPTSSEAVRTRSMPAELQSGWPNRSLALLSSVLGTTQPWSSGRSLKYTA